MHLTAPPYAPPPPAVGALRAPSSDVVNVLYATAVASPFYASVDAPTAATTDPPCAAPSSSRSPFGSLCITRSGTMHLTTWARRAPTAGGGGAYGGGGWLSAFARKTKWNRAAGVEEGKRGAEYKFIKFVSPQHICHLIDEYTITYIHRLTDECIGPTFFDFKTEEYTSFIFLSIEKYKNTQEYILLFCSNGLQGGVHIPPIDYSTRVPPTDSKGG
jgi:hypothetical protein